MTIEEQALAAVQRRNDETLRDELLRLANATTTPTTEVLDDKTVDKVLGLAKQAGLLREDGTLIPTVTMRPTPGRPKVPAPK
jgi:hypothetical protein